MSLLLLANGAPLGDQCGRVTESAAEHRENRPGRRIARQIAGQKVGWKLSPGLVLAGLAESNECDARCEFAQTFVIATDASQQVAIEHDHRWTISVERGRCW